MAYEVRETSGKLIAPGNYGTSFPLVQSNVLKQVNNYTKDRDSGKRRPPRTPDRSGRRSTQRTSSNPRLQAAPRVIQP